MTNCIQSMIVRAAEYFSRYISILYTDQQMPHMQVTADVYIMHKKSLQHNYYIGSKTNMSYYSKFILTPICLLLEPIYTHSIIIIVDISALPN